MDRVDDGREEADAIIERVRAALTPIWLGNRQRMILADEIAKVLQKKNRRIAELEGESK